MKKLSKLKLHNVAELSDAEMKNIVGGAQPSSMCQSNEFLYQCSADFQSGYTTNPETTYSIGAICAKSRSEANEKARQTLIAQGVDGGFAVKCI